MYDLESDTNSPLITFTNDYVEDVMDAVERAIFEEYMATDAILASFVKKSAQGKKALKNAYTVKAAPDFEEKLYRRIASEKETTCHNALNLS